MLASAAVIFRGPEFECAELRYRWRELEETGARAEELAGGLAPERLWWRPGPGRWSVGECLDHLVLTGEEYLRVLDEAISRGRAAGRTGTGPFRRTLLGRWIPRTLEPPRRMKFPAPRIIHPRRPEAPGAEGGEPRRAGESPLPAFLELRGRMRERLEAADGLHLGRVRVHSPFIPLLSVDLDSAFALVTTHERRHLWQAEQVLKHPDFPAAPV